MVDEIVILERHIKLLEPCFNKKKQAYYHNQKWLKIPPFNCQILLYQGLDSMEGWSNVPTDTKFGH